MAYSKQSYLISGQLCRGKIVAKKMTLRFNFQVKLFISLVVFSCLVLILVGAFLFRTIDAQLHQDLGSRARLQASEIAQIPELAESVKARNITAIAQLMDAMSEHSDASYMVIGDSQQNHLYHSYSPESVNTPMVGGDNAEVLAGKTIISVRKGSIGFSLRSKAPIFDENHHVIGIVSVGYLTSYIDDVSLEHLVQVVFFGLLLLLALFIFSWWFSKNLKKQLFY